MAAPISEVRFFIAFKSEKHAIRFSKLATIHVVRDGIGLLKSRSKSTTIDSSFSSDLIRFGSHEMRRTGRVWNYYNPAVQWTFVDDDLYLLDKVRRYAATLLDDQAIDTAGAFLRISGGDDIESESWDFDDWTGEPNADEVLFPMTTMSWNPDLFDQTLGSVHG